MKKILVIVLALTLIMGLTAELPAAMAATAATPKVFAIDLDGTDTSQAMTTRSYPIGFVAPDRMVSININNGVDSMTIYDGTLQYDKTVRFKTWPQIFTDHIIPKGTIGAIVSKNSRFQAMIPTNIKTWDQFRKHVIGLPEEVANSPEPPAKWPLATRTDLVEAESPYEAGQKILADLKAAMLDKEFAISKEIANNSVRYMIEIKSGKTTFGLVVYGELHDTQWVSLFVKKLFEGRAIWDGYIGTLTNVVTWLENGAKK